MTAIPEAERVPRDVVLLQSQDTAVASTLSHVTPLTPEDSPLANVPDMTLSLRKHTSSSVMISSSPQAEGDPRYAMQKCPVFPLKEYQPVETFVSNAITCKEGSAAKPYRAILDAIRKKQDPPLLCKVLLALSSTTLHHLTSNPKQHDHLLHLLFRLDPFLTEEHPKLPNLYSLADAHLHLLLALVSANSVFVTPAMNALWRLLTPRKDHILPPERAQRLHALCANIVRLVPKGNSELFPILASNFPFRIRPFDQIMWYAKQCLAVLPYIPTLHGQVLELLLDKCLEMDVEIKIDVGGQVSIENVSKQHSLGEEMFELELDEPANDKKKATPMQQDKVEEKVDEMADKLDELMTILLEHIQECAKQHGTTYIYRMISPVFDSSILTTHRSKFVQFVILYICGLQHETTTFQSLQHDELSLDREFAAKLIDIVMDPYRATVTRQSGACYLASFVSRATYVSAETACEAVAALLKWAEAYMDSEYSMRASDLREQCDLHSLFYTVCQAAFYIMCFRGADAIQYFRSAVQYHASTMPSADNEDVPFVDPDHVDIGPDRWTKICGHGLKPLRFCLESVRGEFLHVAHVFQLLPPPLLQRLNADDSKMSTNTKRRKSSAITTAATLAKRRIKGGVGGMGRGSNPLDSFFPYDPYLLARSHCFVEPFYKNWEGGIEDDNGELSDDEKVDEAGSVGGATSDGSVDDGEGKDDGDEDGDDDEEQPAHMAQSVDSKGVQPMSYVSNATMESTSTRSSFHPSTPDALVQKKLQQKEAWSETLKRSRAPSIENGSW